MVKLFKNKAGFTLVEVLIAMAITTIIVGTISSMVLVAQKSYINVESSNSVLNGVNSITEMVREYTFSTTEAEISNVTAVPANIPDYTIIACIDNQIYVNGALQQSAKGIGISTLALEFSADPDSKLLSYTLSGTKEDGSAAFATQSLTAYLNACEEGIKGDATGNCLTVCVGELTPAGVGGGGGAGGGGGGTPVPETPTEATTAAPAPEATTEATTTAPVTEAPTEATTAAPAPEAPTEGTTAASEPDVPSGGGSGSTWLPGDSSGIVTGLGEATENNSSYAAFDDINGGETFDEVVKVGKNESFTINVSGPSKVIVYICADDNAFTKGDVTATLDGAEIGREALGGRKEATADNALIFEVDASGSIVINPEYKALLYKIEVIPK